jgi:hypothetical protein
MPTVAVLALALFVDRNVPGQTAVRPAPSAAVREVLALMEELRTATLEGDVSVHERLYAPDFVLTSQSGTRYGRAEAIADAKSGFERYENSDVLATAYDDTVIVNFVNERKRRAVAEPGRFRVSTVWVRSPAGWRIVLQQSSRIAF